MIPTKKSIEAAHEHIKPYIHKTPVLSSESLNQMFGLDIYFKCENFQKIGAFKMRGAANAALKLSAADLQKGLATHSSGNHAQAVALAAKKLNTKAFIVMPSNSPKVKVNAVLGYGAEVIFCEPNQKAREKALQEVVEKTGAFFIHPYDNYDVIEGQATAAKELIEEISFLDKIFCPIGGGGLLSGTLLSAAYFGNNIPVIAGEPEGANDAFLSLQKGEKVVLPSVNTIADGLLTSLGDKNFEIILPRIQAIITVTDEEIKQALRLIWERMKIIIEPSCAVPLAALIKERDKFQGQKIGIILSGGNVDLAKVADWL